MSGRRDLYGRASSARTLMARDQAQAERQFAELLDEHPNSGLVYLMRAEARRGVGLFDEAQPDYQRAEGHLTGEAAKTQARQGAELATRAVREPLTLDLGDLQGPDLPTNSGEPGRQLGITLLLATLGISATLLAVLIRVWRKRAVGGQK